MYLFNWLLIRSKTKALARLSGAKAYVYRVVWYCTVSVMFSYYSEEKRVPRNAEQSEATRVTETRLVLRR